MEPTIKIAVKGLFITAIEKASTQGVKSAKKEINTLYNMAKELVRFWDLDESLLNQFDGFIIDISDL